MTRSAAQRSASPSNGAAAGPPTQVASNAAQRRQELLTDAVDDAAHLADPAARDGALDLRSRGSHGVELRIGRRRPVVQAHAQLAVAVALGQDLPLDADDEVAVEE